MVKPDTTKKYAVPALEKGLDILEYLSEMAVPQSQTAVARALGRSNSEIFRMLACLEQRGYLLRDEAGMYQLSLKLYTLAHTHSPLEKLLEAARDPMRDFARNMRESVHLSVLENGQLLVIAEELSPKPIRISVEVGRSFPATQTASGRLLLAQLTEKALTAFLQQDSYFLHSSKKRQKELSGQVQALAKQTCYSAESDITVGVRDLSVTLPSRTATLTVPILMLKDRDITTDKLLTALQTSAIQIGKRLGER